MVDSPFGGAKYMTLWDQSDPAEPQSGPQGAFIRQENVDKC